MAYTVAAGDILEVSIASRLNGQRLLSVFHYVLSTGGGPIDGIAAIDSFDGLWNLAVAGEFMQSYADAMVRDVSIEQVVYQWIHTTRRARIVFSPANDTGEAAGTALPQNLSAALTKRSEVPGRLGNGTLHMPGLAVESVVSGELNLAGVAVYNDLIANLPQVYTFDGNSLTPVIYHRAAPALSPVITTADVQQTVRTMHRRTVGVGE